VSYNIAVAQQVYPDEGSKKFIALALGLVIGFLFICLPLFSIVVYRYYQSRLENRTTQKRSQSKLNSGFDESVRSLSPLKDSKSLKQRDSKLKAGLPLRDLNIQNVDVDF
jgi:hypothetical protein